MMKLHAMKDGVVNKEIKPMLLVCLRPAQLCLRPAQFCIAEKIKRAVGCVRRSIGAHSQGSYSKIQRKNQVHPP
ncbi:hypothetical protein L195_g014212 [Trifolium pratense]|uniref:Uncharacterized protein n=2 Tax=Trifolium TaxID=3898 RepID=A0A2K3PQA7_TRIPR|nr:hypothetical protein L195_g014212 [Trifolium pratense]